VGWVVVGWVVAGGDATTVGGHQPGHPGQQLGLRSQGSLGRQLVQIGGEVAGHAGHRTDVAVHDGQRDVQRHPARVDHHCDAGVVGELGRHLIEPVERSRGVGQPHLGGLLSHDEDFGGGSGATPAGGVRRVGVGRREQAGYRPAGGRARAVAGAEDRLDEGGREPRSRAQPGRQPLEGDQRRVELAEPRDRGRDGRTSLRHIVLLHAPS
jgi:hypothetical protein